MNDNHQPSKPPWAGPVYQPEYTTAGVTVRIPITRKGGYVATWRAPEIFDMLAKAKHHKTFILLTVIALRARYSESQSYDGLHPGEALLGDYKEYGLTRQQYRTGLKQLEKWGFLTIKTTTKGTIVTLLENPIYQYDYKLSNHPPSQQLTIKQPTANH
jgi:hypothetical protein